MQQAVANFWSDGLLYRINDDGKSVNVTPEYDFYLSDYDFPAYWSLSGMVIIPSEVTNQGVTYPVTGIDEGAFAYCTKITSVTIPPTVNIIGDYAFEYCEGLNHIYSYITRPQDVALGEGVFDVVPVDECILHVPKGAVRLYSESMQWKA